MIIFSNAKINLTLKVNSKTKNNLHEIQSLFCLINLKDKIKLIKIKGKRDKIIFNGPFAKYVNKSNNSIKNLLKLLRNLKVISHYFSINITKNIPVFGGLGGGTGNAAFILKYILKKKISRKILDQAEKRLFDISQNKKRPGFVSSQELALETIKIIENLAKRKEAITGVPSGFKRLDKMTAGLQASDLIILAARPGMGKTSFGLNIVLNAAITNGLNVGFFSLEMTKEQLMMRMLSSKSKINFSKIRTGFLSDNELENIRNCSSSFERSNIYIDDTPAINSLELRSRARRLKSDKGLDLLIVDYLQLMRGVTRNDNREREIAEISSALKSLAKELQIPIIAISQLSRQTEARTDKKPQLSDLRESGALEQDADMVLFIHRADAYKRNVEERDGIAEIINGKQRNGPTGPVTLAFLDSQGVPSFENLAEEYTEDLDS